MTHTGLFRQIISNEQIRDFSKGGREGNEAGWQAAPRLSLLLKRMENTGKPQISKG